MLDTRDYPKEHCKNLSVFFLKSVASDKRGIQSNYTRHVEKKCPNISFLIFWRYIICKQIHLPVGPIHSSSGTNCINNTIYD
ncbi:hypothetical protein RYX36_021028 [Vicia faba]